ncbi:hypothetical protein LXJ15735_05360 [Lacrimispora xylanolytica]
MGLFDWLFGKEKKPPEPLVLGAKLRCPYGSQDSYLYVDSQDIKINNLPKACVDDSKALFNILPFGDCYAGGSCETLMNLNDKWENPVPQGEKVNGKEIITTESLIACKVIGAEFKIISSGQDGIFAKQILFCEEMDQKYPGLREVLENPYGSLYLNKGMYNKAIKFIEDQTLKKGDIDLYTLFDEKNVEGNYLRSAFGHLLPYCDTSTMEGFVNGMQTGGVRQGISNDEGWNELKINKKTIEFLKKDCKETAHNIDTKPFYRWQEENKVFSSALADGVNTIAYAAIMYSGIKNVSNSQSKYSKPVTQKVEAKGASNASNSYLNQQYKYSLIKQEVATESKPIMSGSALKDKNAINALTADGSDIGNWYKMESNSKYITEFGEGRVHFYKNMKTGEISTYDAKIKVSIPKDLRTPGGYDFWIIDLDKNFIPIGSRY